VKVGYLTAVRENSLPEWADRLPGWKNPLPGSSDHRWEPENRLPPSPDTVPEPADGK
jgi:hypothetical protein